MSDAYMIIVVELLLACLVIFSKFKSCRKGKGVEVKVIRGSESREKFGIAYGFSSVLLLQVINSSAAFMGHKVFLSISNITMLFYLCFLSGWFRNRLVGWIGRWENTPE